MAIVDLVRTVNKTLLGMVWGNIYIYIYKEKKKKPYVDYGKHAFHGFRELLQGL
jgi:hypothetical protein